MSAARDPRGQQPSHFPRPIPRRFRFHQVDVFSAEPLRGNPLAVVHGAEGLDDARMAAIARWTNLSETTFLLPPTDPAADYRVRIFTPFTELPFAGHPTLGSAWAWLAAGGVPKAPGVVVQECGVGLVRVKRDGARLGGCRTWGADRENRPQRADFWPDSPPHSPAMGQEDGEKAAAAADLQPATPKSGSLLAFAAPPQRRSEPLDGTTLARIAAALGLADGEIQRHRWIDNGPGWCGVLLPSGARVRGLRVDWAALGDLKLGVVGLQAAGEDTAVEVRAFIGPGGFEDPVTGSLNASVAQWLVGDGVLPDRYVAAQGHALQRAGRVHVAREGNTLWIGGDVTPVVEGTITL